MDGFQKRPPLSTTFCSIITYFRSGISYNRICDLGARIDSERNVNRAAGYSQRHELAGGGVVETYRIYGGIKTVPPPYPP